MINAKEAYEKSQTSIAAKLAEGISIADKFLETYFDDAILKASSQGRFLTEIKITSDYIGINRKYLGMKIRQEGYRCDVNIGSVYIKWGDYEMEKGKI